MTQPDRRRADQRPTDQPPGVRPSPPRRPPDQRRLGRARNRRDDILRVAFDLFAERGYRGTALSAVAERAGLTQQGLLHYFPGKEALLAGVLHLVDELDVGRLFAGPADGAAALDRFAEVVTYDVTRPGVVRALAVLAAESLTDDHPAHAFFTARCAQLRQGVAAALRAESGGALPAGLTPEGAAALLIAVMDGLRLQWLLEPTSIDMPGLFTALLDLLRKASPDGP